jgi:membrane-associated phospholipid phosphatase
MAWLSVIYDTLALQPLLLITILVAGGAQQRLSAYLLAWMIALALTLAIAPFTPAVAAYLYFGVTQGSIPGLQLHVAWEHVATLNAVRDGSLRQLGMDTLFGIVTFPSFHAAGAVLLGWGFHGFRLLRWPFHALNAGLFASAIFVGGHYIVDLVAGAVIAGLSITLAMLIVRRRQRPIDSDHRGRAWLPVVLQRTGNGE